MKQYDLIIAGAGASGLMAALSASREGLKVLLLEKMEKAGRKVRIIGNLKEGKAYVYATVAGYLWGTQIGNAQYCVWEFENGIVKDEVPTIVNYFGTTGWWSASVQQLSLDDPTLYVMYNNELNYPSDPIDTWEKITPAAHFEYYTPGSGVEPVKLNALNHKYRILDNRVFEVNGAKLMAILHQSYSSAGNMSLKIMDITDPNRLSMKPGDTNYDKFAFFESALVSSKPNNDARYGSVAIDVQNSIAHVYVYFPAQRKEDAMIQAYKINVVEE